MTSGKRTKANKSTEAMATFRHEVIAVVRGITETILQELDARFKSLERRIENLECVSACPYCGMKVRTPDGMPICCGRAQNEWKSRKGLRVEELGSKK